MASDSPVARARFINGLRDLANFLGSHFGYPVPDSPAEITIFPDGTDYAQRCAHLTCDMFGGLAGGRLADLRVPVVGGADLRTNPGL